MIEWTEEREARLRQLWADARWSARQIAEELGGVTRVAVIGKAYRLGLSKPTKSSITRLAKNTPRPRSSARQSEATEVVEPTSGVSLLKLTATTCRWPYGEPGKESFFFCGAYSPREQPYCAYHQKLAKGVAWGKAKEAA